MNRRTNYTLLLIKNSYLPIPISVTIKRPFLILLLLCFAIVSKAQFEGARQIFESPNLKAAIATHKVVAILPFGVQITYRKQPKNVSAQSTKDKEQSMAYSIQASMYTYLLRRADDYTVSFQDVEKTNTLLKKAGMLDKLGDFTKDEIAKALGVDAILSGIFETEQTKSDGAAIATTVLFGSFGSKTGTGTLFLALNNGPAGDLLWRFYKSMDDSLMGSTEDLVERMMKKVSRNFPDKK